jgi:hypothetical protein
LNVYEFFFVFEIFVFLQSSQKDPGNHDKNRVQLRAFQVVVLQAFQVVVLQAFRVVVVRALPVTSVPQVNEKLEQVLTLGPLSDPLPSFV